MKDLILIITTSDEPNVNKIIPYLEEHRERYIRINTDTFFVKSTHKFGIKNSSWMLCFENNIIFPQEVKSIWYRRPGLPVLNPLVLPIYQEFARNETAKFSGSLWSMFESEDVLWVNRPDLHRLLEFNKPYQMITASKVGLNTPRTLITNNCDDALDFFDECNGKIIIKPFGGSYVQNEEGDKLVIYTKKVIREQLLEHKEEMKLCPILLQEYVEKNLELRVTVVGKTVFACAIHSQDSERTKDDWRKYDFQNVRHEAYLLPEVIEEAILDFMQAFGLQFGAIDIILTPRNEYFFLEVNPSGQWGWIEALTGLPISKQIARVLSQK